MIHELEPDEFEKTGPVFAPVDYHLTINSIIRGLSPARIFVDNVESPISAFTWFKSKAWIAGDPCNNLFNHGLRALLADSYYEELKEHGASGFRLHFTPTWKSRLDAVFGLPRSEYLRHYYRLDPSMHRWDTPIPNGFRLQPVDADLLSRANLGNLNDVLDEMRSERLSVESFLEKSFGYVVIHGGEIVGWCMSEYNSGNRCELGIATVEGYRRMGLATLTGRATIGHALAHGVNEIGWHCLADNIASIATAKRLRFNKQCEYPVYWIKLTV